MNQHTGSAGASSRGASGYGRPQISNPAQRLDDRAAPFPVYLDEDMLATFLEMPQRMPMVVPVGVPAVALPDPESAPSLEVDADDLAWSHATHRRVRRSRRAADVARCTVHRRDAPGAPRYRPRPGRRAAQRHAARHHGDLPRDRPRSDPLWSAIGPYWAQADDRRRPADLHGGMPGEHPGVHLSDDDRGPCPTGHRGRGPQDRHHRHGARPVRRSADGPSDVPCPVDLHPRAHRRASARPGDPLDRGIGARFLRPSFPSPPLRWCGSGFDSPRRFPPPDGYPSPSPSSAGPRSR